MPKSKHNKDQNGGEGSEWNFGDVKLFSVKVAQLNEQSDDVDYSFYHVDSEDDDGYYLFEINKDGEDYIDCAIMNLVEEDLYAVSDDAYKLISDNLE